MVLHFIFGWAVLIAFAHFFRYALGPTVAVLLITVLVFEYMMAALLGLAAWRRVIFAVWATVLFVPLAGVVVLFLYFGGMTYR